MRADLELVSEKSQRHLKDKVIVAIKKDPRFALFFMGPSLKSETTFDAILWGQKVGLTERDARYFESDLLRVGLWTETSAGLRAESDFLELGELKVIEYMTMTMNILSKMSETGPCWYEALYVSTTHDLKKEFLANINRVLKDFIEKSAKAEADTIVAWTHGSLDYSKELELKKGSGVTSPTQENPR